MKPAVLIVENDSHTLRLLEHIFTNDGFEVFLAEDGAAFSEQALARKHDCIILDIILGPQQDGAEIYQELLSRELDPEIPVVFLSAVSQRHPSVLALVNSRRVFMTKPFDYKELLKTVRKTIQSA